MIRSMPRLLCVLSALLLLGACASSKNSGRETLSLTSAEVNTFIQEVIGEASSVAASDVLERLGPPVQVNAEAVADAARTTAPDTLRTLIYYGLELSLYEPAAAATSSLWRMALTDARYTSPDGLRVGFAESQVYAVLGLPTRQEHSRYHYESTPSRPFDLTLIMERRVVSRIEWHFDVE